MKFSEKWLREWVNPAIDSAALADQLTFLGLEVDALESARPGFEGVVVARVINVEKHPDADRLRVCSVDDGSDAPVQIVCGAPNVRAGMATVLARVGGTLPDGTQLKKARLRGIESFGMLCSAAELGLSEQRDGLMELPADAAVGQSLVDYLDLEDTVIDVDLTPDRGDCLSIRGIARDVCARNDMPLQPHEIDTVAAQHEQTWPVAVQGTSACVRYVGRVITELDLTRESPVWLRERLRRGGVRAINAAVDVTNYVMLELGQPMHAFDLDKLQGTIQVRLADEGETVTLLDERDVVLQGSTTVIADDSGAIGIAGIMGGLSTSVTPNTRQVFLESALFLPEQIIGKPNHYNAQSESSHRFERGVDPALQGEAMEYATRLLLAIAGGRPGPLKDWQDESRLPHGEPLRMRSTRLARILGIKPAADEVERILQRLGIGCEAVDGGWQVTPPSYRYDLRIEEDFIEEIGRVHGYEQLPRTAPPHRPKFRPVPENRVPIIDTKQQLVHRGYQEVIAYSFVDAKQQALLRPDLAALPLANPISQDMSVMRTTLIGGLLDTMRRNQARQTASMKLFETGLRFVNAGSSSAAPDTLDQHIQVNHGDDIQMDDRLWQQNMIAGLVVGRAQPENWNTDTRDADFYDVKADLNALFARANGTSVEFVNSGHAMLHPGQSVAIISDGTRVGYLGCLNPALQKLLDLPQLPLVFELSLAALGKARVPQAGRLSRFPGVRRDIALLLAVDVTHQQLLDCVHEHGPNWLQDVRVFDVYRGDTVDKGKKSIALGLIMQDFSRTLEELEVERAVAHIIDAATRELGAVLRV